MDKWEEKKLGKISTLITKGTTPTTNGFKYQKQGIGFLKVENINENKIDTNSIEFFISDEANQAQSRSILKEDDMLFSIAGTIGKIALVRKEDLPLNTNQALAIIRGYQDYLTPDFLRYTLTSKVLEETKRKARGGALQNISLTDLKEAEIPLPPLPEQKRIVAKLDGLFEKIDQAIGLSEENIATTQALMGSVLDEEFEKLEESSKVVRISEIAEVKGGKRLPNGQKLLEFETDYPYIRVTDFSDNGTIELEKLKYITKEIHEQISRYIITNEDLYISIAGTIGKTGIIPKELNGANLTENAAKLVYKDKSTIDNSFVYYYTKSDKFKRFVEDSTKQVAQPKLALTRLKEIKLALPSLVKQKEIVEKFRLIEQNLIDLEKAKTQKLNHLKALKSSLLDQAFKGEL